jgi:hypothetical protein
MNDGVSITSSEVQMSFVSESTALHNQLYIYLNPVTKAVNYGVGPSSNLSEIGGMIEP